MACCDVPIAAEDHDGAFTVDASRVTFGRGCLAEGGDRARALGLRMVALFADAGVVGLPIFAKTHDSLVAAGLDVVTYTDVHVEPTDASFLDGARLAQEAAPDGYVSRGGRSVIDTCKAANLYTTYPADFLTYVNAPTGEDNPVPGPLKPHIACPTTAGTGSEVTGITIFDLLSLKAKTGIASHALRPTEALVDPDCTASLPREVVASAGLDVLSHALEPYTARPYVRRPAPERPSLRPMSQGANPWSDLGCREALRLLGEFLTRAVRDPSDSEAREQMMWAATLAGIAFGNAGVHAPHGMAYAVAGLIHEHDFRPSGYPANEPLVPHGMAVILNAPSSFQYTAEVSPERHLEGARLLGADTQGAGANDAGEVLSNELIRVMRAVRMPNGLSGVGYTEDDVVALTEGAYPQQRLLQNAPREMSKQVLADLFRHALRYW